MKTSFLSKFIVRLASFALALVFVLAPLSACAPRDQGGDDGDDICEDPALEVEFFDETISAITYTKSSDISGSSLYYNNSLFKDGPFVGDPFLLYDDGVFYLYGTTRKYVNPGKITEAFEVYFSTDLVNWTDGGACYTPEKSDWCKSRLWAPEVYKIDGRYYMYYTGAVSDTGVLHGSVCVADSPIGPFSNKVADGITGRKPIFDFGSDFPTIDGTLFTDDDGSLYYFFVRDQIGDNSSSGGTDVSTRSTLWGVELENPYTIKEGSAPVKLTEVGRSTIDDKNKRSQAWELQQGKWNEGPFVLKHDGKYYLTYSANYFGSKYYAIGYAVSDSPLGSYTKPKQAEIMGIDPKEDASRAYFCGTGHAMFLDIGGEMFVVYHTLIPDTDTWRHFTVDRAGFREDGSLYINGPTVTAQYLPGEVSGVYNIASEATVSTVNIVSGGELLTDGEFCTTAAFSGNTAVSGAGEVSVTLEFDRVRHITGVMVYNGNDYDASFVSVDNIKLGQYYSFDNIPVLSDTIDSSNKLIYAGSCAILELSGEALAQSVTITFSCDSPINISEIVVLGVG